MILSDQGKIQALNKLFHAYEFHVRTYFNFFVSVTEKAALC